VLIIWTCKRFGLLSISFSVAFCAFYTFVKVGDGDVSGWWSGDRDVTFYVIWPTLSQSKDWGVPLSYLPKTKQTNLPACSPHYRFNADLQAGKQGFTILFCCANNIAGKILPRWLLDSKTLNGHFAAVLSFLISFAYRVISFCLFIVLA